MSWKLSTDSQGKSAFQRDTKERSCFRQYVRGPQGPPQVGYLTRSTHRTQHMVVLMARPYSKNVRPQCSKANLLTPGCAEGKYGVLLHGPMQGSRNVHPHSMASGFQETGSRSCQFLNTWA